MSLINSQVLPTVLQAWEKVYSISSNLGKFYSYFGNHLKQSLTKLIQVVVKAFLHFFERFAVHVLAFLIMIRYRINIL